MIQQTHFWVHTSERTESRILKRYLHTHSSTTHKSQKGEATHMSTGGYLDKQKCGKHIWWNIIQP